MLKNGLHDIPSGKVAMIVTYLEMRAKPDLVAVDLQAGVTFRQVQPDAQWFRDIFRRVGSADWLWYGRLKLDDAALVSILDDPAVEHYTLTQDGRDEALLELDFRKDGACELAYFGLTSALIGRGCGRYLMNQAIRRAWSRPIKRFHLQTCTLDSPQALAFYRRNGFTPLHQRVEIDDDPRLAELLPRDAGPNVPVFTS